MRISQLTENSLRFSDTLEEVFAFCDDEWKRRTRRGTEVTGVRVAAVETGTGRWLGSMGVPVGTLSDGPSSPLPVSVYMRDGYRGDVLGITDALLQTVIDWARSQGDHIGLSVREDNERAIAAYAKSL